MRGSLLQVLKANDGPAWALFRAATLWPLRPRLAHAVQMPDLG